MKFLILLCALSLSSCTSFREGYERTYSLSYLSNDEQFEGSVTLKPVKGYSK